MEKSPVDKFPGHIVLHEVWNIKQLRTFENTLPDANSDEVTFTEGKKKKNRVEWKGAGIEKRLPALLACVKEWHIEGVPDNPTADTFPVTPIGAAGELVDWIYNLLNDVWLGAYTVPNE